MNACPCILANVMDGADVGVIQGRSRLCFTLKAGECLRIACHIVWQELECDETVQAGVLGLIDHAHPAATYLFENAVVRNGLADHCG